MKKIVIFGATGTIGQQTIQIIEQDLNNFELVGFSFNSNLDMANKIRAKFPNALMYSSKYLNESNVDSFENLIKIAKPDLIVNAIVGVSGLQITKLAMDYKINLALANKESLVMAGNFINEFQDKNPQWKLLPIDSEHSSLYELLNGFHKKVKKLYITASGGPFWSLTKKESYYKTFEDAIKHPNWSMGYKISIDSATLINKCYELIESHHLFRNLEVEAICHPQSIVHAMVEYNDGSIFANMSHPTMLIPISLALHDYKDNAHLKIKPLSFLNLNLTFNTIDSNKWLPIKWAYDQIKSNNCTIGTIINIVDDFVIELFKQNKIYFGQITEIIDNYINKYIHYQLNEWDDIYKLKLSIENELTKEYLSNE